MDENDKIFLFKQGLQQSIGRDVTFRRPTTLFEAIEYAAQSESTLQFYRSRGASIHTSSNYSQQNATRTDSTPMELSVIDAEQGNLTRTVNVISNGQRYTKEQCFRDGRCFTCYQVGHRTRECPKKQLNNQNYPKGMSRQ